MEKQNIIQYLYNNPTKNQDILLDFINNNDNWYSRENITGHITASAFILNNELTNALLIFHNKHKKWLAPGGHIDSGENSLNAAIRESFEEVGINNLQLLKTDIFDIDIHKIPSALKNGIIESEHWHFDIRYLFRTQPQSQVHLNAIEACGFKWPSLNELSYNSDPSISRQAQKSLHFIKNIGDKLNQKHKY